jgi:hypothetical protein
MRFGRTGFELNHCKRCGRKTTNGSDLCWECNRDYQRYMKDHPLPSGCLNIDLVLKEDSERWEAFIHELAPTLKRLAKR